MRAAGPGPEAYTHNMKVMLYEDIAKVIRGPLDRAPNKGGGLRPPPLFGAREAENATKTLIRLN